MDKIIENNNHSEVARLMAAITAEYEAGQRALRSFSDGTSKHTFISTRMERMGEHQQALKVLVGEEESWNLVCVALDTPTGGQEENTDGSRTNTP